jgi:hypothetical protein
VSNPDKHKPLSAEELFKRLDDTSNTASDFDKLDDFERDALEGFSAYSDAQKAKVLTDELNVAIFKKASESNTGGTKNRVIWFSAAASIVLAVMLSVFFFNQTKEDSVTNIALNELHNENTPNVGAEESKAMAAAGEVSVNTEAGNGTPLTKVTENTSLSDNEVTFSKDQKSQSSTTGMSSDETFVNAAESRNENKPSVLLSQKLKKDELDRQRDDLKKPGELASDNLESVRTEKKDAAQEQMNDESNLDQNVTTASTITKNEEGYYKSESNRAANSSKKSKEKQKAELEESPVSLSSVDKDLSEKVAANGGLVNDKNTTSAPSSSSVADNKVTGAYYNGSEIAIRDYVLNYLKEKQSTVSVAGTYKIKGVVSTDGKLKVSSISQLTKVNCNCDDTITEALNTMVKWNSAIEAGKNVSSNVEFIVAF